jgi:raffinose/stachyose/melibiose transport system substrate-binding protein
MTFNKLRPRVALVAGAVTLGLALTACGGLSGGDSTSSEAGSDSGNVELTFLVNSGETNEAQAKALVDAFQKENPSITIKTSTRPGGGEGDNLVKTKLATGEMEDMFQYNAGSLLQALSPDQSLVNIADQPWVSTLSDDYKQSVSTANGTYGAPWNSSMSGGILYNKDIYAELGLEVPTTWDEFMANSQKIKDAGKAAPIIQTYGDTWTSQMWILADFYNVSAQVPDWAEQYTANKVNFSQQPAFESFSTLEQAGQSGLFNEDFASATYDDAIKLLATGTGAQYPMLTFAVQNLQQLYPDALDKIGVFPMPGTDSAKNGLTVWMPDSVYITKTVEGAKLEAAQKFQAFLATKESCDIIASTTGASGPFVVDGCTLPTDVPAIVADQQPYFDDDKTGLALEFLSPVKGPALEQIAVSVGSGITSAVDGAAQYDEDVKKQAQQLGLAGW